MEVKINITDESKFNEVLTNELNAFTKEELHEICQNALLKYMENPDLFAYLFVKDGTGWSGKIQPTGLLEEAARKIDFNPLFKDVQEKIISYISDNYQKIIDEFVKEIFIRGFENTIVYRDDFIGKLRARLENYT